MDVRVTSIDHLLTIHKSARSIFLHFVHWRYRAVKSILIGLVQPKKEVHLERWTAFFETFPVGPNRSIQFLAEISGNFGWMDRAPRLHVLVLNLLFGVWPPSCAIPSSSYAPTRNIHGVSFSFLHEYGLCLAILRADGAALIIMSL